MTITKDTQMLGLMLFGVWCAIAMTGFIQFALVPYTFWAMIAFTLKHYAGDEDL